MLNTVTLVTISHHTKLLQFTDYISFYAILSIPVSYLFYEWKFVPFYPFHLFHPTPHP